MPFYARRRPWWGGPGSGRHVRSQACCAKDPGRPRTWEVGAQRPALSRAPSPSGQAPGRPGTGPALAQASSGPYLPASSLRHGPEHARGGSLQEQHLPSGLGAEPRTGPREPRGPAGHPVISSAPRGPGVLGGHAGTGEGVGTQGGRPKTPGRLHTMHSPPPGPGPQEGSASCPWTGLPVSTV